MYGAGAGLVGDGPRSASDGGGGGARADSKQLKDSQTAGEGVGGNCGGAT